MTATKSGLDEDELLGLRPFFMDQTRSRLVEIQAHQQAMVNQQDAAAAMKSIRDIAHRINGTAETFGFADLGKYARRVEDVNLAAPNGLGDLKDICAKMESAVKALVQEMLKVLG